MNRITRLLFITFTLLLSAGCNYYDSYVVSTEPVGEVVESTGFPAILRNARPYMLAKGSKIYPGDIVSTDEQSLVVLGLETGITLTMATRSELFISLVQIDSRNSRIEANLSEGAMEISAPALSDTLFSISTTHGDVQTRAPAFWLGYQRTKNRVEVIHLSEGSIEISNLNGAVVLDRAYQGTLISPGSAPRTPRIYGEERYRVLQAYHHKISH